MKKAKENWLKKGRREKEEQDSTVKEKKLTKYLGIRKRHT